MPPKKIQSKIRSDLIEKPFLHFTVQNFLSPELYAKTCEIYDKLQFKQKSSDLFHFFQTNQLNAYQKLNYFKEQLDEQFWRLKPMSQASYKIKKSDTFYSMFASYYFQGDYLLCHDDIVEDRVYAYSYYLEDHDSGDLVLFNSNADKAEKRIKVRKNTLAIFQVSDVSYHEVDYTKTDGRKAITGWFNIKGYGKKRIQKQIQAYKPCLPKPKQTKQFELPVEYTADEYFQLMDIQYQFNIKRQSLQGPFFSRRVHKIEISPAVLFVVPGYKLLSVQFYNFKEGDYILLNDPVNTIKSDNIVDIFVTYLPQGFKQSEDDMLVKITQPNQQPSGIPEIHDSLFVVHRGKKQYYVDRVQKGKEFVLAHFIYVQEEKVLVPGELKKKIKKQSSPIEVYQPPKNKSAPKSNKKDKENETVPKKQKSTHKVHKAVKTVTKKVRKQDKQQQSVVKIQTANKSSNTRKIKKVEKKTTKHQSKKVIRNKKEGLLKQRVNKIKGKRSAK